ncbi:MAG TPA: hypothetical protein VFD03_03630 [Clostridia bacterium]|nr:hypothetical protein [Clostridia bacterium]
MNMFFDVWIRDKGSLKYTTAQELAFETILNYVYDRISPLIDEIEVEELIDESDGRISKAVVIYLLNDPKAIQPRGYSDQLCNKINSCFNENDGKVLWESVENALSSLMN